MHAYLCVCLCVCPLWHPALLGSLKIWAGRQRNCQNHICVSKVCISVVDNVWGYNKCVCLNGINAALILALSATGLLLDVAESKRHHGVFLFNSYLLISYKLIDQSSSPSSSTLQSQLSKNNFSTATASMRLFDRSGDNFNNSPTPLNWWQTPYISCLSLLEACIGKRLW